MIRAGVRLYKWCAECGKVTEHGEGAGLGMTVQYCKVHPFESWDFLVPLPLMPWLPVTYLLGIEFNKTLLDMPNKQA